MKLEIELSATPNQDLATAINGQKYEIKIRTMRGRLYIWLRIDGEPIAKSRALLSFAPFGGGLMLIDTMGTADPTYDQLGKRFRLMHWPAP